MFGQNNKPQEDQLIPDQAIEGALAADAASVAAPAPSAPAPGAPVTNVASSWGHPGTPLDGSAPVAPTDAAAPTAVEPSAPPIAAPVSSDLLEIKQHALTELAPLVDHLEQSPEEKFRTTMMMLQASDDQSLVAVAYESALAIEDEKVKAQALLDVINEINYFTQQATAAQA